MAGKKDCFKGEKWLKNQVQFQIHEKYLKADVGLSVDGELMDD